MIFLKRKEVQIGIIISILAGIGLWNFIRPKKTDQPVFKVEKPTQQNITQYISATGTLKAKDQILIGSLVAGKVQKLYVDTNDVVKKGQTLVELDNGIGDSAVKRAQAQLADAQAKLILQEKTYFRLKKIYEAGQLSKQEFDRITHDYTSATALVDQIQAILELEKKQYNNLFITSPEDGVIISRHVNLGQMVTAQLDAKVLFEIAKDLQDMEAHVDIDEADVGLVQEGNDAYFTVDAFPNKRFISNIHQLQYQVKIVENVKSYNAVMNIKNPKKLLRPGMTTNVDILVANQKNVLAVPNKALRINGIKLEQFAKQTGYAFQKYIHTQVEKIRPTSLWILDNNTIKQVPIVLGANNEKYTEVKKGITPDAQVIVEFIQPTDSSQFLKSLLRR